MSSAAERRAEAIERISKVRAEVEAKEAEKAAKAEAVKQRKRETKRRWAQNNPERAKVLQAKKNAKKTINIPNPPTKCPTIGMKLNGPAFGMTKKVMSNQ